MPRRRKTGAVYPIKYETRKKLADGRIRVYTGYHAKIDGRWVTAKTYKECDRKIREALHEKVTWGVASNHAVTLGEYADRWYESRKDALDPNTRRGYRSIIDKHLKPYAALKLADVTPSAVRMMIDRMTTYGGREAAVNTKKGFHQVLNLIFKAAVADRIIPTNPVNAVRLSLGKDRRVFVRSRGTFTDEQVAAMLYEASKDLRSGAVEWFRILTGMRQGEVLGAVLADLELFDTGGGVYAGYYHVNWQLQPVSRTHGCGTSGEDGRYPCGYMARAANRCTNPVWDVPVGFDFIPTRGSLCLVRPKTGKPRTVPIVPQLGTVLHRYLELVKDEPNPYGLLFHDAEGAPCGPPEDRKRFHDLLVRAGIPDADKRHIHECRRTMVSRLFSEGVDPGKIQRIIGHSSIEMSEYYREVPKEELLEGMEQVGDVLALPAGEWSQ